MPQKSRSALIALALCAVLALVAVPAAAEGPAGTQAAAAAKKKCGKKKKKKGKKGAQAAKKCGKKKGKRPAAGGPELPLGDWYCQYGSFQVQAGNRYTVNRSDPGTYKYTPELGHVDFIGGSYDSFYGMYDADAKVLELYSAINDPPVEIGDYGWYCNKL